MFAGSFTRVSGRCVRRSRVRWFPWSGPVSPARRLAVFVSILVAAACGESSLVPPTAPSPLKPHKVGLLGIDCPVARPVQSMDGRPIPIAYPAPRVRGGEPPIAAACDPESGTRFPVGATRVSCAAGDALGQEAACSFVVRVLPPPMLGVTRILAFGDSLTAGVLQGSLVSPERSYPGQLAQRLGSAYRAQTIHVFNEGLPGELAVEAPFRLSAALSQYRPEVVLLMEGTNDLGPPGGRSAAALEALDNMLRIVQMSDATPVLATIPPVRESRLPLHAAELPDFNHGVRSVAAARGVPLIDIHGVIASGQCPASGGGPLSCLGPDGVHPTVEGYGLMADAFFDYIVGRYDQPVTARADPSASALAAPGPAAAPAAEGGGPRED